MGARIDLQAGKGRWGGRNQAQQYQAAFAIIGRCSSRLHAHITLQGRARKGPGWAQERVGFASSASAIMNCQHHLYICRTAQASGQLTLSHESRLHSEIL